MHRYDGHHAQRLELADLKMREHLARTEVDPEPAAFIVRCERNEAERVTRDKFHASTVANACACGGEHTIRPSSVTFLAGSF